MIVNVILTNILTNQKQFDLDLWKVYARPRKVIRYRAIEISYEKILTCIYSKSFSCDLARFFLMCLLKHTIFRVIVANRVFSHEKN